MADKVWLIDGNRLKEKAVPLLFPTEMEPCGHLPDPVQAVTVSEIEGMLYREGLELTHCQECQHWRPDGSGTLGKCMHFSVEEVPSIVQAIVYMTHSGDYCSMGERRENDGSDIRG